MKELTKAEEQVMRYLWKLKKAFLKDIVESYPEPRPAYTTVSTVIRVLVKKGFIKYNSYGKVHEYFPSVSKSEYFRSFFNGILKNFFNGSPTNFASFFAENEELQLNELEEIRAIIDQHIQTKRSNND